MKSATFSLKNFYNISSKKNFSAFPYFTLGFAGSSKSNEKRGAGGW